MGGTQQLAVYPSRLASPDLTWETSDQYTLGADISLFDGRLNVTADAYLIKTRDLLLNANLPYSSGYRSVYKNIGKVRNRGLEISLSTVNVKTRHFEWSSDFNISFNRSQS